MAALLEDPECAVLQWQVILGSLEPSKESSLEVRVLCASAGDEGSAARRQLVRDRVERFFYVEAPSSDRFQLVFVGGMHEFQRSSTGNKVIKFVDRYNTC